MEEQFVYSAKDGKLTLEFSAEYLNKEFLKLYFEDGVYISDTDKMLKVMKQALTAGTVKDKLEELMEALMRECYYDEDSGVKDIPEDNEELKVELYKKIMLEDKKKK